MVSSQDRVLEQIQGSNLQPRARTRKQLRIPNIEESDRDLRWFKE